MSDRSEIIIVAVPPSKSGRILYHVQLIALNTKYALKQLGFLPFQ
jgi:hypothetical protein